MAENFSVQSKPLRVRRTLRRPHAHLHAITVELDLMHPTGPTGGGSTRLAQLRGDELRHLRCGSFAVQVRALGRSAGFGCDALVRVARPRLEFQTASGCEGLLPLPA